MKTNGAMLILMSFIMVSTAFGDEVTLRNGSSFTGIVREEGDRVVVEMDFGTMTFKKVDVRAISRGGEDPIREFENKSKSATDVKSMMELASWARDKGLTARMTELYRKVIRLDPNQAEARKALGYEKITELWLEGDDLMVAKGFVKVNGRWLSKDTAELIQAQEAQARLENDRLALAARIADQNHSREMAKIALERERLDAQMQQDWWWGSTWYLPPVGSSLLIPQATTPLVPAALVPITPVVFTCQPPPFTPMVPVTRRR
jgi:hypothetical protein